MTPDVQRDCPATPRDVTYASSLQAMTCDRILNRAWGQYGDV